MARFTHSRLCYGAASLINFAFWCKPAREPSRIPVKKSGWFFLICFYIHLPPLAVSILLVWLNLRGYYIGQHLAAADRIQIQDVISLALVQVAAKIQELFVLGSLSVIVCSAIRDRLLSRGGIPLGFATSGLSFTRISYFWSQSFVGGFFGILANRHWEIIPTVGLIIIGGLSALTVGPASAILMLPRVTTFSIFDTPFWLNGNSTVQWPTNLTNDHSGGPMCDGVQGLSTPGCISNGIPSLQSYYATSNQQGGYQIPRTDTWALRTLQAVPRAYRISMEAWSFAPHAATALLQNDLTHYDPHVYPKRQRPSGRVSTRVMSKASAARTVCEPRIKSMSNDTLAVDLPLLSSFHTWAKGNPSSYRDGPYEEVNLEKPLWGPSDSLTNSTSLTTVLIPYSGKAPITAGLIVLGPVAASNSSERFGVVCSMDARWHLDEHSLATSKSNALGSTGGPVTVHVGGPTVNDRLRRHQALPLNDGSWEFISASSEWLRSLTPLEPAVAEGLPVSDTSTMTTALANVILTAGVALDTKNTTNLHNTTANSSSMWIQQIESIASTVLADAISRIGLQQQLQSEKFYVDYGEQCQGVRHVPPVRFCPGRPRGHNHTAMMLHGFRNGYAYKASRVTDYLSIAVVCLYISVVLAYLVRTIRTRRICTTWTSAEEMILLAQTSQQDEISDLRNTSVGIRHASTMGLNTRIRTLADPGNHEPIQLVISASRDDRNTGRVEEGREYGSHFNS